MKLVSVQFLYVFHYAGGSSSCIDCYTVEINFSSVKIITLVLTETLAVCIKHGEANEVQVLITTCWGEKIKI